MPERTILTRRSRNLRRSTSKASPDKQQEKGMPHGVLSDTGPILAAVHPELPLQHTHR